MTEYQIKGMADFIRDYIQQKKADQGTKRN